MKRPMRYLATALLLAVSANSWALEPYAGANLAHLNYSETGLEGNLDLTNIMFKLGAQLDETFAGELRLGVGIGEGASRYSDPETSVSRKVKIMTENMLGAYVKARTSVFDAFYPYAMLGYTRTQLKVELAGVGTDSEADTGLSYGFGTDIVFTDSLYLNFEYMKYFDEDDVEFDGYAIGFTANF